MEKNGGRKLNFSSLKYLIINSMSFINMPYLIGPNGQQQTGPYDLAIERCHDGDIEVNKHPKNGRPIGPGGYFLYL